MDPPPNPNTNTSTARARRHHRSHNRNPSGVRLGGGALSWASSASGSGSGSSSAGSSAGSASTTASIASGQRTVHPLPENPYRAAVNSGPGPNPEPNRSRNHNPLPLPFPPSHNFNTVFSPTRPNVRHPVSNPGFAPGFARPALYTNLDPYNPTLDTPTRPRRANARTASVPLSSDEVVRLLHPYPYPDEELVELVRPAPQSQNQNQQDQYQHSHQHQHRNQQGQSRARRHQPLYGPYAHPGPSHLPSHLPFSTSEREYTAEDYADDIARIIHDLPDVPELPDLIPDLGPDTAARRTPPPAPAVTVTPATPETRPDPRVRTDPDRLVAPGKWTAARREHLLAEVLSAGTAVLEWERVANELQMPVNEVLRQMRARGALRERVLAAARGEKKCGCKCECFEGDEAKDGEEEGKSESGEKSGETKEGEE